MDRNELIRGLAKSVGLSGKPETTDSHYDRTTGTLFIGSKIYHTEDLEEAKGFFSENKMRTKDLHDASTRYFEIGEVAIDNLLRDSLGTGGRVVVKED